MLTDKTRQTAKRAGEQKDNFKQKRQRIEEAFTFLSVKENSLPVFCVQPFFPPVPNSSAEMCGATTA